MARLVLGLLVPLAQSSGTSGTIWVLVVLLVGGLVAYVFLLDRATQRRRRESPALYEDDDDDRLLIEPEDDEEGGGAMPLLYVEGVNGQIEVDDEWVRIHRKGLLARGVGLLGRGVQIRMSDVVDLEISYPRLGKNGWLRVVTPRSAPSVDLLEAARDGNTVMFKKRHLEAFDNFREELKALIESRSNEGFVAAVAEAVAAAPRVDFATQIREIAALRDEGLLTEEEFQTKKAQLLSE